MIIDAAQINVPTSFPPGIYELYVGWYDKSTGQRMQLLHGGDEFATHHFLLLSQ